MTLQLHPLLWAVGAPSVQSASWHKLHNLSCTISSIFFPCPSCKTRCVTWKCHGTTTKGDMREHCANDLKPDPQFDPVCFHQSLSPTTGAKHIGIAFSTIHDSTGQLFCTLPCMTKRVIQMTGTKRRHDCFKSCSWFYTHW